MARADVYTILPLDSYARIFGLNPLHFNGARLPDVTPEPFTLSTPGVAGQSVNQRPIWQQYEWQDTGNVSRDELARSIQQAEFDIAEFLGYWPAPRWISAELSRYPRPYRPDWYSIGWDVRGQLEGIKTKWAKVIQPGRRATTLIGTATVAGGTLVYSDPNGDGWNTLATITLATTLTDECEIKAYFANENADQIWEIRPPKTVSISGGFVTMTFDSWLLFDPDVTSAIPTGEITAINASTPGNYVTSVEVYREFTDFTQPSAQFIWEREPERLTAISLSCQTCGGTGCEGCSLVSQDGCMQIRDGENGMVAAGPNTYSEENARWEKTCWTECRAPDQVKVWYRSGLISERGLRGSCNQLDSVLARNIAVLATARLTCRYRAGTSLANMIDYYRRDTAESFSEGSTIFTPPTVLDNPFGTRRGEVEVYKSLQGMRERKYRVGVAVA
jgi:hypothetical protein